MMKRPDLSIFEVEKKKILSLLHNDLFQKMLIILSTYNLIRKDALRFLKTGHKPFTRRNALKLPILELSPDEIFILKSRCEQFKNNKGLTRENSVDGLGNDGLFCIMRMFNFLPIDQQIKSKVEGYNIIKITFKHQFGRPNIVLYNKVKCSL